MKQTAKILIAIQADQQPAPSALPFIDAHRRDVWAKMLANRHPFMVYALDAATKTGTTNQVYGDVGQYAAIYYQVTGDTKYIPGGYTRIMARLTPTIIANEVREYFGEYIILYSWIRDQLTADQRAAMESQLKRWADYAVGLSGQSFAGGFATADTDQTMGQYFGLQLCDLILGTNYTNAQIYFPGTTPIPRLGVTVGGLDATGANLTTTIRNALAFYCQEARDGVWPVWSSEYDPGDLDLLFFLSRAVNSLVGRDCFPEATALIPRLTEQIAFDLTPDLANIYEHGDDETPRNVFWWNMERWLCVLAGHNPTDGFLAHVIRDAKPTGFIGGIWRALYVYDPYTVPNTYTEPRGCDWNPTVGDIRWRNPDTNTLFAARWPLQVYVQHQYNVGDHQLYANGEWSDTRPIGYGTRPEACNSTLLFGLPSMDARSIVAQGSGADYCWMTGASQGQYYAAGYFSPPETFVNSWRQTTVYIEPGVIIVRDVVDLTDPRTLPKFTRYSAPDQATINATTGSVTIRRHCPVAPAISGNSASWQTVKGNPVYLTVLSPDPVTLTSVDETAAWTTVTSLIASEKKFHVRVDSQSLKTSVLTITAVGQNPAISINGNMLTVGTRTVTFNDDGTISLT